MAVPYSSERISRRTVLRGTFAAAGISAAMILAACGSSPSAGQPSTGSTGSAKPAGQASAGSGAVTTVRYQSPLGDSQQIAAMVKKFEAKNPTIRIKSEAKLDWGKITPELIAGTAADIMWGCCVYVTNWIVQKLVQDLQDYVAHWPDADAFMPTQWKEYIRNGHQYGIPVYASLHAWYYNKDIFNKANASAPTKDDLTWDDLRSVAKNMTKVNGSKVDWFGAEVPYDYHFDLGPLLASNGLGFYKPETNSVCTLDNPKALDLLQWYADWRWKDHSVPSPAVMQTYRTIGASDFQSDKAAMHCDGSSFLEDVYQTAGFSWGLFPMPKGSTGKRNTNHSLDAWVIYIRSKVKDAAWTVLEYGCGVEWETIAMGAPSFLQPARLALQPKWVDAAFGAMHEKNKGLTKDDLNVFADAYKYATPELLFSDNTKAMNILQPALDQVFKTGTAQAKDVIPPAVKQVNEALKNVPSTLPT